jgi:hypothetical protein
VTGHKLIDGVLAWLLGLVGAFTPAFLYRAFGFNEFEQSEIGKQFTRFEHWTARIYIVLITIIAVALWASAARR